MSATRTPAAPPLRTRTVVVALAAWLAAAVAAGAAGLLHALRPPAPQLLLLAITAALLLLVRLHPPLRAWVRTVDWRALVLVHVARALAGGTFLMLVAREALPRAFVQAGVGDVTVALLASLLVAFVPPSRRGARRLYLAWNVLGLADILLVLATGVRLGLSDPAAVDGFVRMPLVLLPTFLVPLVLATHVLLFVRLRAAAMAADRTRGGPTPAAA